MTTQSTPAWWVWKFGGSSLADLPRIKTVAQLIEDQLCQWYGGDENREIRHTPIGKDRTSADHSAQHVGPNHLAVVVSAIGGMTNILADALRGAKEYLHQPQSFVESCKMLFMARLKADTVRGYFPKSNLAYGLLHNLQGASSYGSQILDLIDVHLNIIRALRFEGCSETLEMERSFLQDILDLVCILHVVAMAGTHTDEQQSVVLGYGEIWSVNIMYTHASKNIQMLYETRNVRIIPLLLNARKVLTICQQKKMHDIKRLLPKHEDASNHSVEGNPPFSWHELSNCGFPFLPHISRSNQSQMKLNKVVDDQEAFCVGPISSRCLSEEDIVTETWAFPSLSKLGHQLLPPTPPPTSEHQHDCLNINWIQSYNCLANWFLQQTHDIDSVLDDNQSAVYLIFITGFIGKTLDDLPTTLQRNGSDASAVAFAALFRAQGVTIWSDVAGIFTGDPRYCLNARPLEFLSYEEALELAGTGAKVLHPGALLPCIHMHLPLLLKSTFQPQLKGTTIADFSHEVDRATYGKVVTTISNVVLFTLSNVSLLTLVNFASRLFAAVEKGGGHPLFISQGSASSAVSLAVADCETEGVLASVVEAFRHDGDDYGSRLKLTMDSHCSVLSVVGRGQSGFVGALAKWCVALRERSVSIKAISQSSNELSTSFVVAAESAVKALEALHGVVVSSRLGDEYVMSHESVDF